MSGFEAALSALKAGRRVARKGWNGKGMFLKVVGGVPVEVLMKVPSYADNAVFHPDSHQRPFVERFIYPEHVAMWTAQKTVVPWLASVTDILAEDWEVLK